MHEIMKKYECKGGQNVTTTQNESAERYGTPPAVISFFFVLLTSEYHHHIYTNTDFVGTGVLSGIAVSLLWHS